MGHLNGANIISALAKMRIGKFKVKNASAKLWLLIIFKNEIRSKERVKSLWFFGHLELFKTCGNIFSEILVITLIIFSKVKPSNKSSFKIKHIIKVLVLHVFFHWINILFALCNTRLLGLWLLLKSPQNVLSSTL